LFLFLVVLNSGLCACKAGALPLEPFHQPHDRVLKAILYQFERFKKFILNCVYLIIDEVQHFPRYCIT
jgi:hypothetical protein